MIKFRLPLVTNESSQEFHEFSPFNYFYLLENFVKICLPLSSIKIHQFTMNKTKPMQLLTLIWTIYLQSA